MGRPPAAFCLGHGALPVAICQQSRPASLPPDYAPHMPSTTDVCLMHSIAPVHDTLLFLSLLRMTICLVQFHRRGKVMRSRKIGSARRWTLGARSSDTCRFHLLFGFGSTRLASGRGSISSGMAKVGKRSRGLFFMRGFWGISVWEYESLLRIDRRLAQSFNPACPPCDEKRSLETLAVGWAAFRPHTSEHSNVKHL